MIINEQDENLKIQGLHFASLVGKILLGERWSRGIDLRDRIAHFRTMKGQLAQLLDAIRTVQSESEKIHNTDENCFAAERMSGVDGFFVGMHWVRRGQTLVGGCRGEPISEGS